MRDDTLVRRFGKSVKGCQHWRHGTYHHRADITSSALHSVLCEWTRAYVGQYALSMSDRAPHSKAVAVVENQRDPHAR